VLDANALIGFFEDQAGIAKKVQDVFEQALRNDTPVLMSAVTWGEVFYVEWRYRGEDNAYRAEARARQLPLTIISVDQERATRAGAIKQKHGLGYADSFAAELAIERSAWLVTADREFEKLGKHLLTLLLPRR
jgi:predicted nucleic acid-binding protein